MATDNQTPLNLAAEGPQATVPAATKTTTTSATSKAQQGAAELEKIIYGDTPIPEGTVDDNGDFQDLPVPADSPVTVTPQGVPVTLIDPWHVYTLEDALTGEDEPWNWVIEDLLLEKAGLLCSGHPHSTKSLDWLSAAMGSVVEHKVWGHFPTPKVQRVLYIETEDPKQVVKKRIRELAKGFGIKSGRTPQGFTWMRPGRFNLTKDENKLRLKRILDEYKPDWCVLSTLQGLIPERDWNQQKDMEPVYGFIMSLCDDYCPIVLITHSPQDRSAKRAAGTITAEANFLTVAHFEKKIKNEKTVIKVEVDSKLGISAKFDLDLNIEGKEIRSVTHTEHAIDDAEMIKTVHEDHPDWGTDEIATEVGCTERYVRTVLKKKPSKVAPLFAAEKKAKVKNKTPGEQAESWYKTQKLGTVFTPQEMKTQSDAADLRIGSLTTCIGILEGWSVEGKVKKHDDARLVYSSTLEITQPEAKAAPTPQPEHRLSRTPIETERETFQPVTNEEAKK